MAPYSTALDPHAQRGQAGNTRLAREAQIGREGVG